VEALKLPVEAPKQLSLITFDDVTVNTGQVLEQLGKDDKLVICKLSPAPSINSIGYVPEGVIVVPVVKLTHEVTFTSQPGGKHPKVHALQSWVVV
jgi:hypothetical protein